MAIRQTTQIANPNLGSFKTIKELVFDDDTGTVNLFTVTGDVSVSILAVCKTSLASAAVASIRLGSVSNTNAMMSDTVATDLDAGNIWNDQSPSESIEAAARVRAYDLTNGDNVVITLDAQVDSGAITFYCYWDSHDGSVASA